MSAPFRIISGAHLCLNGRLLSELLSRDRSRAGGDVRSCDPGSYVNHQQRLACGPLIPLLLQTPALYCPGHGYNIKDRGCIGSLLPSVQIFYFKISYARPNGHVRTD